MGDGGVVGPGEGPSAGSAVGVFRGGTVRRFAGLRSRGFRTPGITTAARPWLLTKPVTVPTRPLSSGRAVSECSSTAAPGARLPAASSAASAAAAAAAAAPVDGPVPAAGAGLQADAQALPTGDGGARGQARGRRRGTPPQAPPPPPPPPPWQGQERGRRGPQGQKRGRRG